MSLQLRRRGILKISDAEEELGLYFSGDLLKDNRTLSFFLLLLVPFQVCHHCSKVITEHAG